MRDKLQRIKKAKRKTGLPNKIQYKLACEAPGAKEFAFGDIFRNLRLSRQVLDSEAVCLWGSRMSKRSKQDLDRLSRRHPSILKCFDKLLAFQGLWGNICPALIRRLGELKCPSVRSKNCPSSQSFSNVS